MVRPSGITATEWPGVRAICRDKLGVNFDGWQDGAGRLILAQRCDGKLAAMVGGVGMSLPRQVGKTYLLAGLIFGLCIKRPGLLVIWSAHHGKTHAETFLAMQAFARRLRVKAYIEQVYTGSGDEEIRFHNGSRILFGARERGFGRGIPGVDVLVMDEAQILSDRALENMLATLNVSRFGLALYIGTPPKPGDNSESFERMRADALDRCPMNGDKHVCAESADLVWIECGADPGSSPDDRKQWRKANPSYPHRTPAESIMRLRKKLKNEGFLREGLGIWDDLSASRLFHPKDWSRLADPASLITGRPTVALEVAQDFSWACLTAAGRRSDDLVHVQVLENQPSTAWVAAKAAELTAKWGRTVWLSPDSPAGALIEPLRAAKVRVREVSQSDYKKACGAFYDLYRNRGLRHLDQPELNTAAVAAQKRISGDGWVFDRRDETDISPLASAAIAVHGATSTPQHTPGRGRVMALD